MMSEGITITVEFMFKPGLADGFCDIIPRLLVDTARFEGFRDIKVVRHGAEPDRVLLVESWDGEDHYKKYIAWRTEQGDMDRTAQQLVSGRTDVWPTFVARA